MYGFSKKALEKISHQWSDQDVSLLAQQHGFKGPGYSDHVDPVQLGMSAPSFWDKARRGLGGAMLGGVGGSSIGGIMGGATGENYGAMLGAALGGMQGWHSTPNQLVMQQAPQPMQQQPAQQQPMQDPKMAEAIEVFGFSKKAALATPGLLQQMRGGIQNMGSAAMNAGQNAMTRFDTSRVLGQSGLSSARSAFNHGWETLGQAGNAGQNVQAGLAGATGLGAAALGGLANKAYRSFQQPPQQRQAGMQPRI